jgi:hypothetical protein
VRRHRRHAFALAMVEAAARLYCVPFVRSVVRPLTPACDPEGWLFVVGCYNSGTTLLKEIIGSHPAVRSMPREGVRFTSGLTRPEDLGWTRMWVRCEAYVAMAARRDPSRWATIVRDWSPWWRAGARFFLEKSISNVARMRWLDINATNAHFIGIVRNGYCAAEGIRRKARPRGAAARSVGDRYPIAMAGEQWVASNRRMLGDAKAVARFTLIRYEGFVSEPHTVLDRLWPSVGLEPPPTSWDGRVLKVGRREFEVRDMNPESIARLERDDIDSLNGVIGPMQSELGYQLL